LNDCATGSFLEFPDAGHCRLRTRPSAVASFLLGVVITAVLTFVQDPLAKTIKPDKLTLFPFFVMTRIYNYIFSLANVNHWRGVWTLWDIYTGYGWRSGLFSALLGRFHDQPSPPPPVPPKKKKEKKKFKIKISKSCEQPTAAIFIL
jgi:hypothetical protein